MGDLRRNSIILAGRVQRPLGQSGKVVRVDDVVINAGMIRLLGRNLLGDLAGLQLPRLGLVRLIGADGQGD